MKRHLSQAHLNDDELLAQMYAGGTIARLDRGAHLMECADCSTRLEALAETKARLRAAADASAPVVSNEFLAAQRRAIYARLDQRVASQMRWAPAVAAAGLLAVGLLLYHPHTPYAPVHTTDPAARVEVSNEQLLSDLYSMEQSVEPEAAAPIHELFEEGAQGGQQ